MNSKEYEKLVADTYRQLATQYHGKVVLNRKLKGKSGHEHEIDVTIEFDALETKFLVIVECKWWSRPVTVEEILVLAQRAEDLAAPTVLHAG